MKQKNFRLVWLIIAVIMLAFVPKEVRAQDETLGAFTVTKGEGGEYSFADGKLTVTAGTVTVSTTEQTSQTIVLEGTAKLILAGVNISTDAAPPIDVTGNDAVIELAASTQNTLESTATDYAGIHVPVGSKVTFTGSGNLDVKNTKDAYEASYSSSCGIGGQLRGPDKYSCGTIIFNLDGTITAHGGSRGAGIGTCIDLWDYDEKATIVFGSILIKNGTINANGGYCASDIGTGPDGAGGGCVNILIDGGTITVEGMTNFGNRWCAGIGNGYNSKAVMYITVTRGEIKGSIGNGRKATSLELVIVGPDATVTDGASGYINGIVFSDEPKTATMAGNVTIPAGVTLTVDAGETLTIPDGQTLTIEDEGALVNNSGTIINNGIVICRNEKTINGISGKVISQIKISEDLVSVAEKNTYTGNELTPEVTVTNKDNTATYILNTDYTVSYSNNTNVGTANIIITPKEYGQLWGEPVTKTFEIVKADSEIEDFTVENKIWDGEAIAVTAPAVKGAGLNDIKATLTYYQIEDDGEKKLDAAPINVGKYKVIAVYNGDDNHNAAETKEVMFVVISNKYERTVTIGNYGTICLPYAVAENARSGAEFFSIAGKKIENDKVTWLVLEEVNGDLNAGQPYIFKATADKLSCTYSTDKDAAISPGNENGLIGSFEQVQVSGGNYVLKDNVIYKCSAEKTWNIAANRAYINMGDVSEYNPDAPSSANHVVNMRVSGGTTGIDAVRTEQQDGVYYNMQGQRVASPSHGIYIVNGKKVIMK